MLHSIFIGSIKEHKWQEDADDDDAGGEEKRYSGGNVAGKTNKNVDINSILFDAKRLCKRSRESNEIL